MISRENSIRYFQDFQTGLMNKPRRGHEHFAVDGVHHLAEELRLNAGFIGQPHHLHHRADVAAGEAGVAAAGGLEHWLNHLGFV